jgi:DNA-binding Lrp family transcriptional regulator
MEDARRITASGREVASSPMNKKLFAFVHIFVESAEMDDVVASLQKIANIEELFHVTGEFDIVTLVSAEDIEQFRDLLKNHIMKISGVRSTVSSVVLHHHPHAVTSAQLAAVIPA